MQNADHQIPVFHDEQGISQTTLKVRTTETDYALCISLPGIIELTSEGLNCFAALQTLRKQAEDLGWRICVQGARLNVYASGFCISMGEGFKAYVFELGTKPNSIQLVDTIAPDEPGNYATVSDQRAFFERWWESVGLPRMPRNEV
jgi:hypothetical protein